MNFQEILEHPLQLYTYDEVKPYASPTTHLDVRLSSRDNRNRS